MELRIADLDLVLDPAGGAWAPGLGALLIADLHLEKGQALGRLGAPLPPYDTDDTLDRLERLLARYDPRSVYALGDSFHDATGALRLGEARRERLRAFSAGRSWIWLLGNHDPALDPRLPGEARIEAELGGARLRHLPEGPPGPVIHGHLHPTTRLAGRRRRCFLANSDRLTLPALGAFAGGLDARDAAICALFDGPYDVYVMGETRVHKVPDERLRAHRQTSIAS